jgi:hypothetical protein
MFLISTSPASVLKHPILYYYDRMFSNAYISL